MSGGERLPLSVVVIARDEADRIGTCLEAVSFAAERIVVDSGSTDGTPEVARAAGARVVHHEWEGYGRQKNVAMGLATQPWVLSIDADEVVTPGLAAALAGRLAAPPPDRIAGFRLRRQLVFAGRPLRFGRSVNHPIRLVRRGRGAFTEDPLHEHLVVEGEVARLPGTLLHYSYRCLADYLETLNRFTTLAARAKYERGGRASWGYELRLPWEFIHRYVLRGGFLDGRLGLQWSLLSAFYVFLKYAKLAELEALDRSPEGGPYWRPRHL